MLHLRKISKDYLKRDLKSFKSQNPITGSARFCPRKKREVSLSRLLFTSVRCHHQSHVATPSAIRLPSGSEFQLQLELNELNDAFNFIATEHGSLEMLM